MLLHRLADLAVALRRRRAAQHQKQPAGGLAGIGAAEFGVQTCYPNLAPAVSLTELTLATVLAVFKPWGRIRPWRSKGNRS